MKALAVAKLTFNEVVKERLFLGIFVLDVLFCFVSYFLSEISAGDNVKIAMDFILAFQFFSSAVFSVLVVGSSFQKDLYQKVIYLIYSKPITKFQYLAGKILGFMAVFFVLSFLMSTVNTVAMIAINDISMLVVPHLILTERMFLFAGILTLMLTMLALLTTLSSLFFSNYLISLFVAFMVFLAGLEISAVKEIASAAPYVSPITKAVVKISYYLLPNFSLYDVKSYIVHTRSEQLNVLYPFYTALYTLSYGAILFVLSITAIERKEF